MKHLTKLLLILSLLLVYTPFANAQLEVNLQPMRKAYLLGEQINLKITLANRTDESITLKNSEQRHWLHFTVTNSNSQGDVGQLARPRFPEVTIPAGKASSFELNIKPYFRFNVEGSYKVTATVRMPDEETTYSSPRASFALTPGSSIQKYTIMNKGQKLLVQAKMLRVGDKDCIFGQVTDLNSNVAIGACYMGRFLNFMEPRFMMDGKQNMHMLCQSTSKYFTYSIMSPDGKRVGYQIYRRIGGPLALVPTGSGVKVEGAIPYVEVKDDPNKVHSVTDRPLEL